MPKAAISVSVGKKKDSFMYFLLLYLKSYTSHYKLFYDIELLPKTEIKDAISHK